MQSQSQLKAIYKDNADTIVGNCDTTLFLGGKEKTTLKEISEILGKETIDSFNTSETRGRELSHGLNYQKLGKELMTQDEIAVMDGGKCILQLRGVRPFFSDKFDMWDFSVIKDLLMNPVYTGAIASQKKDYRFKIGTIGEKKSEDWIVVEGQHEPLIDRMSFDIVQNKLKSRQRPGQTNEISLFAGLIKCGECGKSLTVRYTNAKHPQQIYSCKTYNAFGKNHCTQHRIDYDTLYSHVLRKIRECARAALMDGEAVADRLTNTCEAEQREQREAMERSLTRDEERIEVLDKMVMRLYEDMIAGRISEQNFNTMLEKTQTEQAELKAKVSEGRKRLSDEVQLANDAKQWVEAIQEYANITELDAATLNRLIKEIVVHERIDEDKTRHISIEIHFNLKPIPEVEQVTA